MSETSVTQALEMCAVVFREYAVIHAAKLNDGLPDAEFNAIALKSKRNREMAEMCEAALSSALQGEVREEDVERVAKAIAPDLLYFFDCETTERVQRPDFYDVCVGPTDKITLRRIARTAIEAAALSLARPERMARQRDPAKQGDAQTEQQP